MCAPGFDRVEGSRYWDAAICNATTQYAFGPEFGDIPGVLNVTSSVSFQENVDMPSCQGAGTYGWAWDAFRADCVYVDECSAVGMVRVGPQTTELSGETEAYCIPTAGVRMFEQHGGSVLLAPCC